MTDFLPSRGGSEEAVLTFADAQIELKKWKHYQYAANLELPTDGWSFSVGNHDLPDGFTPFNLTGSRVELKINGTVQGNGYVDSVEVTNSRSAGTEYNISGRDRIAQAVDACADPTRTFKEGMTLEDVLVELFKPFGWSKPEDFIIDNSANVSAKAGIRGTPRTKGGKKKGPRPLKSFIQHQLRPYPREGVFQFAARISERHGLKIWQTASGDQIVVSTPDFDIDPFYTLRRNNRGTTNVLEGSVRFQIMNQATCIVADGSSGGGEFGRGRIKSIMANTLVFTEDPAFIDPWARYPGANRVLGHKFSTPVPVPRARTLYLHDEESTTQFQLDNFVRREMAKIQKESLQVRYTVEGHGQVVDGSFVPWTIDTTVDVEDEVAGLTERLYVLGRTFHRSRTGGTMTSLDLIRLNTMNLGEPDDPKPAPKASTDGAIVREREFLVEQSAK